MKTGTSFTAMDAGINRALEGLRVCEDIFRFAVKNSISSEFKLLRHRIAEASAFINTSMLLKARDVESDGQKFVDTAGEGRRTGLGDVFRANIRRAAESVRSLEELAKTVSPEAGAVFQNIRFGLYDAEKRGWFILERGDLLNKLEYRLYALIDSSFVKKQNMASAAAALIGAGAGIIQLRLKDSADREFLSIARDLCAVCREGNALFVVNDRPDIAMLSEAQGLHLGQADMSPEEARRITGEGMIIGLSVHNHMEAAKGLEGDADYIAIGPVFSAVTKTGELLEGLGTDTAAEICRIAAKPVVCFGGITHDNIRTVMETGCSTAAVISSLYTGGDTAGNTAAFASVVSSFSKWNLKDTGNEKEQ